MSKAITAIENIFKLRSIKCTRLYNTLVFEAYRSNVKSNFTPQYLDSLGFNRETPSHYTKGNSEFYFINTEDNIAISDVTEPLQFIRSAISQLKLPQPLIGTTGVSDNISYLVLTRNPKDTIKKLYDVLEKSNEVRVVARTRNHEDLIEVDYEFTGLLPRHLFTISVLSGGNNLLLSFWVDEYTIDGN
jgi:hypothetical protein